MREHDFTPIEMERLVTTLFHPTRTWKVSDSVVGWLYAYAAKVGDEPNPDDAELRRKAGTWPLRSRMAERVGLWLQDLGIWTIHRKAAKRLKHAKENGK